MHTKCNSSIECIGRKLNLGVKCLLTINLCGGVDSKVSKELLENALRKISTGRCEIVNEYAELAQKKTSAGKQRIRYGKEIKCDD